MQKIIVSLLIILLPFFLLNCGSHEASQGGTGSIALHAQWPNMSQHSLIAASVLNRAPAGIVTVRVIISGPGMTDMQQDFSASAGQGTIQGVPAGTNRTVTLQALGATGKVVYQNLKSVPNITVIAGQTTDCGTIWMDQVGAIAWISEARSIVKVSSAQEELLKIDTINCSGLSGISPFAWDSKNGRLWISDTNNNRVIGVDENVGLFAIIDQYSPGGPAIDPRDGSVWTSEYVPSANGVKLIKLSSIGLKSLETGTVKNVAVYDHAMSWYPGDNSLWVADYGSYVYKLWGTDVQLTNYNLNSSSSTNHLRIGPFGQAFALSSYPSGTGHVWVVDRFTALIKYAIDGTEVLRIPFSTIPGLSQLIHVSTDTSDGSAWIGDDGGGRIAKYSAAGNFILGVAFSQNALEADPFDGGAWVGSGTGLVKLSPTGVQEWSRTNGAVESIVLQTQSSQYKTIYVDKSGNDTSGNGSASNAYLTIGKGISVANEGDKIIVGAGTYNENISLKSGISIIGAGSSVTTIQGLGSSNVIDGAGAQNVTIAGFTITGAGNTYTASDIYCANCNGLIIRECSIVNNGNSTTSTGISLSGATSNALIERNIITGHGGYGLLIYGYTMIRNNIIAHNNDSGIVINGAQKSYIINNVIDSNGKVVGGLSGMMISGGNHVIKNNIISNNGTNNPNPGVSVGIYVGSGTPSLSYNNVYNNYQGAYTGVTAGTGDIASNPSYVNSASGDYHLQSGSPSINTGDPTLHDAGVPCSTIPATRSDMGAYGGPWGNW